MTILLVLFGVYVLQGLRVGLNARAEGASLYQSFFFTMFWPEVLLERALRRRAEARATRDHGEA